MPTFQFSKDLERQRRDVHDLLVVHMNQMAELGGDPQTIGIAMLAAAANVLGDMMPGPVLASVLRQMADVADRQSPRPRTAVN